VASAPRRISLMQFHDLQGWKQPDYEEKFQQAKDAGLFDLGMLNPKTNKRMYQAWDINNLNEYYFCFKTAELVISFIQDCVTHTKPNRFAKFPLHESQKRFYANVFGWKRIDTGQRRFMEVFKYIPRKNSKTFDIASLVHIGMIIDGEGSPEIYSVAKNKNQAKLIQEAFVGSIRNDQEQPNLCANGWFARFYDIHGTKDIKAVTAENQTSVYKAIPSDEGGAHGLNCHFALCDEIHTWSSAEMFDVLQTSMGARFQPLIVCLTTADYARESFCNKKFKYAKECCVDPNYDERFLPVLYYADEEEFGDDWNDKSVWYRVNPLLGTAKNVHIMEREYKQATNQSLYENAFKRLHLNICTKSESSAYDMVRFDRRVDLPDDPEQVFQLLGQPIPEFLRGAKCYGGFDGAYKWDLSAFVLDFPDYEYVLCWNWIHSKHKEITKYKKDFKHWLLTAGTDEINFEKVGEHMNQINQVFDIVDVGFDPNQSRELIKILEENKKHKWECYKIAQTARNLSEPIKHTISSVEASNVNHNGNSCFMWQLSNADIKEDNHNNYMFVKPKGVDSRIKKIDGAVSWAMARARRLEAEENEQMNYITRFNETGKYF
jgi:phage terminase large subunit-like protein